MKKALLDTSAFSAYLAGDKGVYQAISMIETVYMSTIVLGELQAGFRGGSQFARNIEILDRFLSKPTVTTLFVTDETSEVFGVTKNDLKTAGTPIPINDVWIASQAIETGSVLITFDSHFKKVPGLRLWV